MWTPCILLALSLLAAPPAHGTTHAPTTAGTHPVHQDHVVVHTGHRPGEQLPPDEASAKTALDQSPRHGEYVTIDLPSGVPMRAWVSYPERKDKAGVVLIVHEIFGLSDWIRGLADGLAREGFIAVAPDLISGMGPNGGGTDSVPSRDDVVALVMKLNPVEVQARLDAARAYAEKLPAANGKVATVGFCWGGGRSFEYAAADPPPAAAVVYYGTPPDSATMNHLGAPVLGFYGGDDARVTATVDPTKAVLASLGKSYEPHVLAGAGHGFLRAQADREGANLAAARQAWPRTIEFLGKWLATPPLGTPQKPKHPTPTH